MFIKDPNPKIADVKSFFGIYLMSFVEIKDFQEGHIFKDVWGNFLSEAVFVIDKNSLEIEPLKFSFEEEIA